MDELAQLVERHAGRDGVFRTAIPSLTLFRLSQSLGAVHTVQEPSFCLIAQGRKEVLLGSERFEYAPGQYLMVSIGMPMTGRVIQASPREPYLSLCLDLDTNAIAALLMDLDLPPVPARDRLGLSVGTVESTTRDAVIRLLRLLDTPRHIATLAPMIQRELAYLLLVGPEGGRLREIALTNGLNHRVARAVATLRERYAEKLSMEELAQEVGMSLSSLHHQFKAVTAMSPLQYQKQVRLQEARQLMMGGDFDATRAAIEVGYESVSQFNREYRRQFGEPPARDVARLREMVLVG
ncbi:MAG: AraC family transcriptional regulator [Fimbriimonas sp.]